MEPARRFVDSGWRLTIPKAMRQSLGGLKTPWYAFIGMALRLPSRLPLPVAVSVRI